MAPALALTTRRAFVATSLCLALLLGYAVNAQSASARTPSRATAHHIAVAVLTVMNRERVRHHLPRLKMKPRLVLSAHRHNLAMARHNTMSHQLLGEAFFATRISRTGYRWRAAGENIGWNTQWTQKGAGHLERLMYNEKAPNNGHRRNILSRTYRDVGIDIYMDPAHHKLWLTQDFGRHV